MKRDQISLVKLSDWSAGQVEEASTDEIDTENQILDPVDVIR